MPSRCRRIYCGKIYPPTHNLSDAATVLRCRELVRSPAVRSVERSADTLLAFALRAVERVVPTARSSLDRPNIAAIPALATMTQRPRNILAESWHQARAAYPSTPQLKRE
jgi:hypothetical protein